MKTLTEEQAKASGYASITFPYYEPGQIWMMHNAIESLKAGCVDYCIVQFPEGKEIWRKGAMLPSHDED